MTPELHRPLAADAIPAGGLDYLVEANDAELAALAVRMRLPALSSLRCRFRLSPYLGGAITAEGSLEAEVVQNCVVTLEDFAATVAEQFVVRFVPAGTETDDIDPEAIDEIPYADGVLDLGEVTAEQLALALDPYPRAPGATLPEVVDPDEVLQTPFAKLAHLRRPT
jgi:hypothetical protein